MTEAISAVGNTCTMPTCQYFGQTSCTSPLFQSRAQPALAPREHFSAHYLLFGMPPVAWVLNGLIWLLIIRFVVWPLLVIPLLDLLDFRRQQKTRTVAFVLTPYHRGAIAPEATREFFTILHAQYALGSYKDHLLRKKRVISCEILSDRAGIRFIVRMPEDGAASFRHAVTALHHEIQLKEVSDEPEGTQGTAAMLQNFRQTRSFVYPLRTHNKLARYDPITQLAGPLAKPKPNETFAVQLVLAPYTAQQARMG